jgi:hypothetical protein
MNLLVFVISLVCCPGPLGPQDPVKTQPNPPAEANATDAEAVRKLLQSLEAKPGAVAKFARESARETQLRLRFDLPIVRAQAEDRCLERRRVDQLAQADARKADREKLVARLAEEVDQIRKSYADSPDLDAEIRRTQGLYGARVRALEVEEQDLRKAVATSDAALVAVRRQLRSLERERKAAADGLIPLENASAPVPPTKTRPEGK